MVSLLTAVAKPLPGLQALLPFRRLAQAAAAAVAFGLLLLDPKVLNDGDTYWHLAAGRWMLEHGRILHVDPFSFTHAGQPWVAHEWLSEIIMALAYQAAGWNGVVLLFAASVGGAMALLADRVGRWLGGISLVVALALGFAATTSGLLTRPHLLALPLLIFWAGELMSAREAGRAPPLWLAGLMLLWANLHGSFVFGFLLLAPFGLEALIEGRRNPWPVLRDWGLVGVLCVIAAALTPHGVNGFLYPFHIMTMKNLSAIVEWRPSNFGKLGPLEVGLLATLFVCLARGVKVPPLRLGLLLFILHMALKHMRHQLVLGLIAPLLLAEPIARALGQRRAEVPRSPAALLLFAAAALVMVAVRFADPVVRNDAVNTPKTALERVPPALAAQPVLNSYSFGGYLIFNGVKPFIDGRSDMYGDALFSEHIRLMRGDAAAFEAAVRKHGLRWTVLSPREPLAQAMDSKPGWRRLHRDRWAVVHVRVDAPAQATAQP